LADALYYDVLVSVRQRVLDLALAGIPAEQVYLRQLPTLRDCVLPAIVVAPWGMEEIGAGDTEDEDYGFPAILLFSRADNQALTLDRPSLLWREQVLESLLKTPPALEPPPSGPGRETFDCVAEPGAALDWQLWAENLGVSWLAVKVWVRKNRR
jgi:hypothetical protein